MDNENKVRSPHTSNEATENTKKVPKWIWPYVDDPAMQAEKQSQRAATDWPNPKHGEELK